MAARKKSIFGTLAILLGGLALVAAVIGHWAGPFAEEPSFTEAMSERAAEVRDAILEEFGEEPERPPGGFFDDWDEDRMLAVGAAAGGALAILFGFIGFARGEELRVALSGVLLGLLAVIFQLIVG